MEDSKDRKRVILLLPPGLFSEGVDDEDRENDIRNEVDEDDVDGFSADVTEALPDIPSLRDVNLVTNFSLEVSGEIGGSDDL